MDAFDPKYDKYALDFAVLEPGMDAFDPKWDKYALNVEKSEGEGPEASLPSPFQFGPRSVVSENVSFVVLISKAVYDFNWKTKRFEWQWESIPHSIFR